MPPAEVPIYPTIQAALEAAAQGCGVELEYSILVSPVEDFHAPLLVPSSLNLLYFSAFQSNNHSIAYSKPLLGRIIASTSHSLQLRLNHLTWVSGPSTARTCFESPGSNVVVDLATTEVEIECELPNVAYGTLQVLSSKVSCGTDGVSCPSFLPISISTLLSFQESTMEPSMGVPLLESAEFRSSSQTAFRGHVTLNAVGETAVIHVRSSSFGNYVYIQTLWTSETGTAAAEEKNLALEKSVALASLPGVVLGTALAGLVHTEHMDGSMTVVEMQNNTFLDQLMIEGDYLSLTFLDNTMLGTSRLNFYSAPQTFTLKSTCTVSGQIQKNTFSIGTVYLGIPSPSTRSKARCPEIRNIYSDLSVKYNHFAAWNPSRTNASVSVSYGLGYAIPRSDWKTLTIDVSNNWWGDATGPRLCCNVKGKGGYPTQLLRPDYWCSNPECNTFSNVVLSEQCVTSCCPQKLSGGYIAVLVVVSLMTYGVLGVGAVISLVHVRRHFQSKAFQFGQKDDLIERIVPVLYMSTVASIMGSLGIIALLVQIGSLYWTASGTPRQERLPVLAIVLSFIFGWLAAAQLISHVLFGIALYVRKRYAKMLNFLSSKQFVLDGFQVAYMLVICIIWGPYSSTVGAICHSAPTLKLEKLSLTYWAEYDSGYSTFTTLLLLPLIGIAIVTMIPQNTLNNLLYRFEYSSITYALEAALLNDLARAPEVAQKAKIARISAIVSLVTAFINLLASIYLLASPPQVPPEAALWPFTFMVWGSPRLINYIGCCILGIVLMLAAIWTTFSYNRPLILTFLTFSTALIAIGIFDTNLFEFAGAYFLRSDKSRAFLLRGAVQILGILLISAFTTTFALLYKLRTAVIILLPRIAISNLNSHLDDSWHNSTSMKYSLLSESEKSDYESQQDQQQDA
jgi:hypothetical protein